MAPRSAARQCGARAEAAGDSQAATATSWPAGAARGGAGRRYRQSAPALNTSRAVQRMHLDSTSACHKLPLPTPPPLMPDLARLLPPPPPLLPLPPRPPAAGACSRWMATPSLAAMTLPTAGAGTLLTCLPRSNPSARKEVGCARAVRRLAGWLAGWLAAAHTLASPPGSAPAPPQPQPALPATPPVCPRKQAGRATHAPLLLNPAPPRPLPHSSPAGWDCYENPCAANPKICQRGGGLGSTGPGSTEPETGGVDPLPPDNVPSCEDHPKWCREGEDGILVYDFCLEKPEACQVSKGAQRSAAAVASMRGRWWPECVQAV